MGYSGKADCILEDGTALPVTVNFRSEQGMLDGLRGTAMGGGLAYMNLSEIKLRFPDQRERMFLVIDAPVINQGGGRLELVSKGDWLG
jgi:hypothetical protein